MRPGEIFFPFFPEADTPSSLVHAVCQIGMAPAWLTPTATSTCGGMSAGQQSGWRRKEGLFHSGHFQQDLAAALRKERNRGKR